MGIGELVNRNNPTTSTSDFVLTWGKRKRLRVKITPDSSSSSSPLRLHTDPTPSSFVFQWGRQKRLRCIPSRKLEQGSAAVLSFIPEDIIIDILARLPVKSLLRFRCVCKSWYDLLKTSNFAELHLNHSLKYGDDGVVYNHVGNISCVDYDSLTSLSNTVVVHIDYPLEHKMERILGTCNGLVCYLSSSRKDIIIWNPCTKDYKKIPTPPETETRLRGFHVCYKYGFGYDLETKGYNFARMANIRGRYSEIVVYSLTKKSWKIYRDIPIRFPYEDLVFSQGILHWVEMPPVGSVRPKMICSLDIGSDEFRKTALPQHFPNKFNMIHVRLLGGCLRLIGNLYMTCSEVWMMKDYGVRESWAKMFSIDNTSHPGFSHLDIRQCYRNGVILVQETHSFTYLYDLNHDEAIQLKVVDGIPLGFQAWPFLGSLVSPNLLGT